MGIMALDIPNGARFQWVPSYTSALRLSMADPRFPYVNWRGGRPRAVHGPRQRALGFVDADLRHPPLDDKGRPVGRRFTMEEAAAFSDKRVAEVAAARAAGQAKPKVGAETRDGRPSARRLDPLRRIQDQRAGDAALLSQGRAGNPL